MARNQKISSDRYGLDECSLHYQSEDGFRPIDASTTLPERYKEFADVFSEEDARSSPPHHEDVDLTIDLLPYRQLPFRPIYPLSKSEKEALRGHLATYLIGSGVDIIRSVRSDSIGKISSDIGVRSAGVRRTVLI